MEEAGVRLTAENEGGFTSAMSNASKAYGGFVHAVGDGAQKVPGFSKVITGALRHMGTIAVDAALQAGKAVVGFVTDSIGVAGDFEGGMNRFEAAVGSSLDGSGVKLDDFKNLFLDLGAKLPVSTKEVQDAAIALVKGGIDPLILKAGGLESSLKFAAAAQMDLAAAAELSAKMLGSFVPITASAAEKTEFMAKAQDLLVKAAGASTLDVDKLGDAMLQAGGQAKVAGLDYEDFVTTMGLISPSFGSASEAGTSFKNFLARLQPSTLDAKSAMSELGLVSFDTNKAMTVLATVGINAAGMSAEQMTDSMLKYAKSINMSKKDTAEWIAAMDKSAFYDAQGNFVGMEKAAGLLREATKDLTAEQKSQYFQQIFGNDAMGAAAALANGGSEAYAKFAEQMGKSAGVQKNSEALQKGYNTAMDNLKGSLEALQITIGSSLLPILTTLFNDYLAPGVNAIRAFADEFFKAPDKMSFLSTTLSNLIPGIGDLKAVFEEAMIRIGAVVMTLKPVVMGVFEGIKSFLDQHGDTILGILKKAWEAIQLAVQLAMLFIEKVIIPTFKAIAKFISDHSEEIKTMFNNAWTIISTSISTIITVITNVIKIAMALINGDTKTAMELLKSTINTVWEAIKTIFVAMLSQIKTILTIAFDAISTIIATKLGASKKEIDDTLGKIKELFGLAWTALKIIVGNALDAIFTAVANKMGLTKGELVGAIQGALDAIKGLVSSFGAVGAAIMQAIIDKITSLAGQISSAVWNAVKSAIDRAMQAIKDFISNPLGSIGGLNFKGEGGRVSQADTGRATQSVINRSISNTSNFNLSLATGQSMGSVVSDFAILRALAR